MSNYGPTSQTPASDFEAKCRGCNKTFRTDSHRQRYCSTACKRSAQNRRHYAKKRRLKVITHRANDLTNYGQHAPVA